MSCEMKHLSDIDDQDTLRGQVPFLLFYRRGAHEDDRDPANIIRRTLGEALVLARRAAVGGGGCGRSLP
jgi:hypothetical protein